MSNDIVNLPCGLSGLYICCAFNCRQGNNIGIDFKDSNNAIEQCYGLLKKWLNKKKS